MENDNQIVLRCQMEKVLKSAGLHEERICRACLQPILPNDLLPEELRLCQSCYDGRGKTLQELRAAVASRYVILKPLLQVYPCLLQGWALWPESFKEQLPAEALACNLLRAGFTAEEAYDILRRLVPQRTSGKTWQLLASVKGRQAWSCRELKEMGISCSGCLLEYYRKET